MSHPKTESETIKEAARKLQCDDEEIRLEERMSVVKRHKEAEGNPEEEAGRDPVSEA